MDRRTKLWKALCAALEKRETPPDYVSVRDIEAALASLGFEVYEQPVK